MKWLVSQDVAAELQHGAQHTHYSVADRAAFTTQMASRGAGIVRIAGGIAEISVSGLLVESPSLLAFVLGIAQTPYSDIQSAVAAAERDPSVSSAVLKVDSPGGATRQLFETIDVLQSFSKPLSAVCSMACSAAYALAATTGSIQAVNAASPFGSVGVATELYVDPDTVKIASTDAPRKRPDVRTAEGRDVVRDELDAIHELLVDAIAKGRKTTRDDVNANYGRGGTLLAKQAKAAGMIDAIGSDVGAAPTSSTASASPARVASGWLPPLADMRRRAAAERERNSR